MILLFILVVAVCAIAYMFDNEITLPEFLAMFSIVFIAVGLVYSLQFAPFPNSYYFQSGRIIKVAYNPTFVEEYEQSHQSCVGDGEDRSCTTYWTTEHKTHHEYWLAFDSLGRSWEIDSPFYSRIRKSFGSPKFVVVDEGRCSNGGHPVSGDPNTYYSPNATNSYNYPVAVRKTWHNPIIGTSSLFNVKGESKLKYPESDDYFYNTRLMTAKGLTFTSLDWDIFNTKLYEFNGANANLISADSHEACSDLEASWTSGGKNDFNICVVGAYNKPEYVKIFGWSSDLYNVSVAESMIVHEGITKKNLDKILAQLAKSYTPTDFSTYNYIKRPCPLWINILACIVAIFACFITYAAFSTNDDSK